MPNDSNKLCNIPNTIAGCSICEKVGSGTFSCVFKAVSASPGNNGVRATVAVKVMSMQAANASKLSSDCVVSEIRILKNLKHRNIVRLYDFQWDRNNIYLIMEFCGGGDLGSFIKHYGSLPEAVTRRFFRQLASAIQYMRAMNVAHMDLKPQNILLTNRYHPLIKVSDFGLSQYLKKNEQASSFRGSPLYMAPEIFCRGPYDSRVDLWLSFFFSFGTERFTKFYAKFKRLQDAEFEDFQFERSFFKLMYCRSCGIILYECLYGVPPFTAHTYDKLVEQILSVRSINFPMNVHLSHVCLDLLQALLVRNPRDRITFERFFTHPFVDLAKLPSSIELDKADSFVKKSEQAESEDNLVEATKLLSSAVQIYIHCLELFDDDEEKAKFREKIKAYLKHAEDMKERLRPVTEELSQSFGETEWDDWPQIRAAELVAHTAHDLECQEQWNEALAKYTLAIESAMHILSNENRGTERSIKLQRKVSSWLSAAERIKKYVQVMNDDYEISMNSTDEDEKQFHQITANKQCVIS